MPVNLLEICHGMSTVKPGRLSFSPSVIAQSNLIQRKALDAAVILTMDLSDHFHVRCRN